jgi:hypothetical protein
VLIAGRAPGQNEVEKIGDPHLFVEPSASTDFAKLIVSANPLIDLFLRHFSSSANTVANGGVSRWSNSLAAVILQTWRDPN